MSHAFLFYFVQIKRDTSKQKMQIARIFSACCKLYPITRKCLQSLLLSFFFFCHFMLLKFHMRLSVWFYEGIFKSRLKIKPAASLGPVPPCCGGTEVTEFGSSQPIGSPQLSIFLCIYLSFLLFCWKVLNLLIYEG